MPRTKLFDETEVLEKAMNLFWEKGYYATSIQDLVNHLGINRASLYDTYGGKIELFKKAFNYYRNNNSSALRQFLYGYEDVRQGLKALFSRAIQDSKSDASNKGCFVVNTTIEFMPNEESFKSLILDNKKHAVHLFRDYLQHGVDQGQISTEKDVLAIANLIFTFYNGLQVVTKVDPNEDENMAALEALLKVLD